jgi:hypothetical protein
VPFDHAHGSTLLTVPEQSRRELPSRGGVCPGLRSTGMGKAVAETYALT